MNNAQRKHVPADYAPQDKPLVFKMMEKTGAISPFASLKTVGGTKKILDGVLKAPYGDESCPFASCFTSVYMYLENFTGTEPGACFLGKYADDGPLVPCNGCGKCGRTADFDFKEASHNSIQWFFMLIAGGSQSKVDPSSLFDYAGYRYRQMSQEDGYDAVKNAVVQSIDAGLPVLMTFQGNEGLCNLVVGYDLGGGTILGYDGNFSYWKLYVKDAFIPKDGYLDNQIFYYSHWFDVLDKVYIITGKGAQKTGLKEALQRLANNIHADNTLYMDAAHRLLVNSLEAMDESEIHNLFETGADLFREQMDTRHKLTLAMQSFVRFMVPQTCQDDAILAYQELAAAGAPGYEYMNLFETNMWDVFGRTFQDYIPFMNNPFIRIKLAQKLMNAYKSNRNAAHAIENLVMKWQREDDIASGQQNLPPLALKDIERDITHQEISLQRLHEKIKVRKTEQIDLKQDLVALGQPEYTMQDGTLTVSMANTQSCLATQNSYSLPVKIDLCLKADKDICLYFGKGQVILNWSDNEREMRIRDIAATQESKGILFTGVPKNEFVNLSWVIHKKFMALTVNDEVKYFSMWSWPYMFREVPPLPFRFGTNRGHTITVKSITISQLEG